MTYSTQNPTIAIPIPQSARQQAEKFASEQPTPEKAAQVYLNTLAVLVVHNYLQLLDIPTDLKASYSWNPVGRLCADVADLKLTEVGHLECRPLKPKEQMCFIPPEVWAMRIGYVVVQLDLSACEGKLLGFVPTVSQQLLPIDQLQPLAALLVRCHQPTHVRLSQWFDNVFETNWVAIAEFFATSSASPVFAFRNRRFRGIAIKNLNNVKQLIEQLYLDVSTETPDPDPQTALIHLLQTTQDEEIRWTAAEILWTIAPDNAAAGIKRIMDLGMQLAGQTVALMVAILPKLDHKIAILVRVYPMGSHRYLPPGLQLTGINDAGKIFLETEARTKDDYIQLKFSAHSGEHFSVKVVLGAASITERFLT